MVHLAAHTFAMRVTKMDATETVTCACTDHLCWCVIQWIFVAGRADGITKVLSGKIMPRISYHAGLQPVLPFWLRLRIGARRTFMGK